MSGLLAFGNLGTAADFQTEESIMGSGAQDFLLFTIAKYTLDAFSTLANTCLLDIITI